MRPIPPCFISAPVAAETPTLLAWNIARAEALGRLASLHGLGPIVPHSQLRGVFSEDNLDYLPAEVRDGYSDRRVRSRYKVARLAMLRVVIHHHTGGVWELLGPDGSRTSDTRADWKLIQDANRSNLTTLTWGEWRTRADRYGLAELWDSLAEPPPDDGVLEDVLQAAAKYLRGYAKLISASGKGASCAEAAEAQVHVDRIHGLAMALWPLPPETEEGGRPVTGHLPTRVGGRALVKRAARRVFDRLLGARP